MESKTKNRQTKDEIIRMVQKAFGSEIVDNEISIKELTEGFYNVAYEITFGNRKVILKIAPPSQAQIMGYEKNIMQSEVEGLRIIKSKTKVPVPEVLYFDSSGDICKESYFFMEKLSGSSFFQLKENSLPLEEQNKILKEAGYWNKEMNRVKGESFGYLNAPHKKGTGWNMVFRQMIEDILKDGENIDIELGLSYDEVRELVEKASFALEEVTEPAFVHWDLWDGNIFVHNGKVGGLIDFERSMWADPLMEYFFRRHSNHPLFVEGYGEDLRKQFPIRALLYDIYLYLIMVIETKYRGYPDDGQYNFAVEQLKASVNELIPLLSN